MQLIANQYIQQVYKNLPNIKILSEINSEEIISHLESLNKDDKYLRFGFNVNKHWIKHYITNIDFKKNVFIGYYENEILVGVCQIASTDKKYIAELAISVLKNFQNNKIGKTLLVEAVFISKQLEYDFISVDYLMNNYRIISWIKSIGLPIQRIGIEGQSVFPTVSRQKALHNLNNFLID